MAANTAGGSRSEGGAVWRRRILLSAGILSALILVYRNTPVYVLEHHERVSYAPPPAVDPIVVDLGEFEWRSAETVYVARPEEIPDFPAGKPVRVVGSVLFPRGAFSGIAMVTFYGRSANGDSCVDGQGQVMFGGLKGAVHPFAVELKAPERAGKFQLDLSIMGSDAPEMRRIAQWTATVTAP